MSTALLASLIREETPFLDVRAPVEFARGAMPGAANLPLLTDEERHRVGITYKHKGRDAAVALGHELVRGGVRRAREDRWCEFAARHPDAWIYCWRGGERSLITQRWLRSRGIDLPRVPGGFKALRYVCLELLTQAPEERRWVVLGGRTGSGKTALLRELPHAIDLEALAQHRGSAFGATERPQPAPVTFEAALARAIVRHRHGTLVLEDESRTIGRLALPQRWHEHMQEVPLALLEVPLHQRVTNIVQEYVIEPLGRGVDARVLHERFAAALARIERRLGGARKKAVQEALDRGFSRWEHEAWVELLLAWYYDPMYDHQLAAKRARVVVHGDAPAVREHLLSLKTPDDRDREAAPPTRAPVPE